MADIEVLRQLEKQFELCKPLFIALGDEMRLTIISALTQAAIGGSAYDNLSSAESSESVPIDRQHIQGLSVKEITNMTSLSRPAISHHLKILKTAGIVSSRQDGTSNLYFLTLENSSRIFNELNASLQNILVKP